MIQHTVNNIVCTRILKTYINRYIQPKYTNEITVGSLAQNDAENNLIDNERKWNKKKAAEIAALRHFLPSQDEEWLKSDQRLTQVK